MRAIKGGSDISDWVTTSPDRPEAPIPQAHTAKGGDLPAYLYSEH